MHILQCMGSKFCVKFQRAPLKFHTKFGTQTLQNVHFIDFNFCVWFTISLNCDVISLGETGLWCDFIWCWYGWNQSWFVGSMKYMKYHGASTGSESEYCWQHCLHCKSIFGPYADMSSGRLVTCIMHWSYQSLVLSHQCFVCGVTNRPYNNGNTVLLPIQFWHIT